MKKLLSLFIPVLIVLSFIPATAMAFTTSMDRPMRLDNTPPETAMIPGEPLGEKFMFPAFDNGEVLANKKQGRLPAMGFNSWNAFGSANTEALAKAMADCFINLGLDKVGYKYIVLDDGCYQSTRVNGKLSNETTKFPSGFKALSDYMHARGLKFGMYNDIGTRLCAGATVGTVGYEDVDAQTYLDWGVDFLKVDNCYNLWDNATNSAAANVQYSFAPRIRSITVSGGTMDPTTLYATDGALLGTGASKSGSGATGYVTNIGVLDGTNTGQTPVGNLWSELSFNVNAPADGTYSLVVSYATATSGSVGRWLQVAVGPKESETRYFDGLLPATANNTTFVNSDGISVQLKAGQNTVRLMNHRRQENTLVSYTALLDGLYKANPNNDVVLSICEWGKTQPQNWGKKVGNSWRILNDITFSVGNASGSAGTASWTGTGTNCIQGQYNKAVVMDEFAGLDKGWNDPDMMVIGMGGISTLQSKTHMTMWSMMNSPLMLGFDLRKVSKGDDLWNIIANKDVIDLNQDPLGIQAKRIYYKIDSASAPGATPDTTYLNSANDNLRIDVLAKPLANGDVALSFINVGASGARSASVDVNSIISYIGRKMVNADAFSNAPLYIVKDLWTKKALISGKTFSVTDLPATDNYTIRISPVSGNTVFLDRNTDGNYTASYAIVGGSCEKALLILAEYDSNMSLLKIMSKVVPADAAAKLETITTAEPPDAKECLKVFMWDADTYMPLTESLTQNVPPADKTPLQAAITKAEATNLSSYSRLTADAVQTALETAKGVNGEDNPSQGSVNSAESALTAALNRLAVPMNLYTKITGTLYGQSGTYGSGRTYNLLFDGNITTFYDAAAVGNGYGGYDVGAGNEVTVDMIRFYPRSDYVDRANDCTFRGSMTDNAGGNTGTLLYTVSGVNAAQWYTVIPSNNTDKFRYIWFQSGPNSWGNMSEVEFYTKTGVDRSLLDNRIAYANILSGYEPYYTPGSWAAMKSALLAAQSLSSGADQSQVDSAAGALKAALAALVLIDSSVVIDLSPELTDIRVAGVSLPDFDPKKTVYDYVVPFGNTTPTIAVSYDSAQTAASTVQASSVPGSAIITLTSMLGSETNLYKVNFTRGAIPQATAHKVTPADPADPNDPAWLLADEILINKRSTTDQAPTLTASGKARVLWDDNYLYARVEVTKNYALDNSSSQTHMQDSVELFLSEENFRGGYSSTQGNQYRVNYAGATSQKTEDTGWSGSGRDISGTLPDGQWGYIVTFKIPYHNAAVVKQPGTVFGLDFQINAMQTSASRTCFAWVDGTDSGYSSSDNWGRLLLSN